MYQYKAVKNPQRPGRPPKGTEWVKENGEAVTNDKGEMAYQPKSEAPAKPAPKKTRGKKKTAGKKQKDPVISDSLIPALSVKKTYTALPYDVIVKINKFTGDLMDKAKEARKAELAKIIDKTQKELDALED